VQVDALAVRLRPRTAMEAADLGVRLCQSAARSVYRSYALVALPVVALALASYELASWLPSLVLWCAKPWLDRTILFVLSRAAFGQPTAPADVWKAQRQVWWSQLLFTWTVRRLSPWRSLTLPVYQLEGLSIKRAGARVRQIRHRNVGSGLMMTQAFSLSEAALTLALVSLVFWLAPSGRAPRMDEVLSGELPAFLLVSFPVAYALAVLFLEPFYVAAGFAMYLNRRAELEAWDIEQEFRRAFAITP
jgi:hypothetical protein